MKKVLFVIDTLEVGGAEQSILEIVSRFRSYTPVVCHLYAGESLKHVYEERGIEVVSLNTPGHYNFQEARAKLNDTVQKIKPVLIHSTLFRSDWVSRGLRKVNNIPLVNSLVNNSYANDRYAKLSLLGKMKLKAVELMDRFSVSHVDHFISNSEAIRRASAEKLAISPGKINVIYRGRSAEKYQKPPSDFYSLREEIQQPEDSIVLLNVSRLLERKGQADLLKAFKPIADEIKNIVLVIVGEGPYRGTLERLVADLKLEGRVFLLGTRNDVPALLAQSSVFIFPSYFEGLPGALIEAMMARRIIVASAIPENLECVTAESAYLFNKGVVDELTLAIRQALTDESTAKGENAYTLALQKFEINSISAQYESLYDMLLQR